MKRRNQTFGQKPLPVTPIPDELNTVYPIHSIKHGKRPASDELHPHPTYVGQGDFGELRPIQQPLPISYPSQGPYYSHFYLPEVLATPLESARTSNSTSAGGDWKPCSYLPNYSTISSPFTFLNNTFQRFPSAPVVVPGAASASSYHPISSLGYDGGAGTHAAYSGQESSTFTFPSNGETTPVSARASSQYIRARQLRSKPQRGIRTRVFDVLRKEDRTNGS